MRVREASPEDAAAVARLAHEFQTEFGEITPGPDVLAERYARAVDSGEATVVLIGDPPEGFAQLRFRASLLTGAQDAYLEELYIVPALRGKGLGRALLEAAMEAARERGASHMDLGTGQGDVAARALYESAGFDNHEGRPDGETQYFYERDL